MMKKLIFNISNCNIFTFLIFLSFHLFRNFELYLLNLAIEIEMKLFKGRQREKLFCSLFWFFFFFIFYFFGFYILNYENKKYEFVVMRNFSHSKSFFNYVKDKFEKSIRLLCTYYNILHNHRQEKQT
uniref:Uncharacterized protein n=1 Tax=Onchocerca volvulus TaxID=6282 RepID=A0A8R1XR45_ONCVO